jgi:hypothetical protein
MITAVILASTATKPVQSVSLHLADGECSVWYTVLAYGGLAGLLIEQCRRDRIRYKATGSLSMRHFVTLHKRGGMWFFRLGRLGGSFYITRRGRVSHNKGPR